MLKTFGLFFITALAEIVGCYLPYLWLRQGKSAWLCASDQDAGYSAHVLGVASVQLIRLRRHAAYIGRLQSEQS